MLICFFFFQFPCFNLAIHCSLQFIFLWHIQIGLIVTRNKRAEKITELSGEFLNQMEQIQVGQTYVHVMSGCEVFLLHA